MFTDCHTHLDQYAPEEIEGILQRADAAGVAFIISAGTTVDSSQTCVTLASQHPGVFAGVGIHPMDIQAPFDEAMYQRLKELATSTDKVIVISEIGLDFMDGTPSRELQYHAFREQIRLARDLGLPIVFHSRDAHNETLRVLQEERAYEVGAIMHYFQGDEDTARRCIDLDFHISLARPLLRLPHLQEVAAKLPLERIVLETDSFPQPFKKKRDRWTEPRHIREVSQKLAELKGLTMEEVAKVTTGNLLRILGDKATKLVEGYINSQN